MPALAEFLTRVRSKSIGDLFQMAPQYAWTVLKRRAIGTYYWIQLHATPTARNHRHRNAVRRLCDAEDLLFLCHGSICRSPFAERYARKQLTAREIDTIEINSAGFVDMNDPFSPKNARNTAESYDVDLTDHQSVKATAEAIETADLILLMDYRNYHNFTTRFPQAAERMFLLRIFESGPTMQIPDPHGYSQSVFSSAYADIATCIRNLVHDYERASTELTNEAGPNGSW